MSCEDGYVKEIDLESQKLTVVLEKDDFKSPELDEILWQNMLEDNLLMFGHQSHVTLKDKRSKKLKYLLEDLVNGNNIEVHGNTWATVKDDKLILFDKRNLKRSAVEVYLPQIGSESKINYAGSKIGVRYNNWSKISIFDVQENSLSTLDNVWTPLTLCWHPRYHDVLFASTG